MKYLGVMIDNKLNWHNHVQYVSTKVSKAAGIIYKLRNKMPQNVLMLLYHALVETYLRYGIVSWGSAKTSALAKLQNIQNKVVRYITHSPPHTNINNSYKQLGILKIDELYILEIGKFMYRNSQNALPSTFDQYFSDIDHRYHTRCRSNYTYRLPATRIEIGKQSVKFSGVKVWSDIPNDIRSLTSFNTFSDQLKSFLLHQ